MLMCPFVHTYTHGNSLIMHVFAEYWTANLSHIEISLLTFNNKYLGRLSFASKVQQLSKYDLADAIFIAAASVLIKKLST